MIRTFVSKLLILKQMWLLKGKDGDKVLYLKSNTDSSIGRNFGDIVFPADKSVSRKHATLYVNSDKVLIEDHKSTYGTYINEGILQQERIEPAKKIQLNIKDVVKFGMLGNEWTLQKLDYTTCLSTFKEGGVVSALKAQLNDLGVNICKDWQPECTHLTMPCITLTLKVVSALVCLRPIVGPSFWAQCLRCHSENLPMPDPHSFLPQIKESVLSQQANFHLEPERSTLFQGKNFIFFSRQQMNNYKSIIEEGGGKVSFLRDCKMTNAQLCAAASIVVQYCSSRMTQDSQEAQTRIDGIVRYMASKKCRVVPESDIGLAILYVSIEKYCNPRFSFASVITEKQDRVSTSSGVEVLAAETEDILHSQSSGSNARSAVVQETLRSAVGNTHNITQSSTSSKDCSGLFENSFIKDEPVCSSTMISATKAKATSPAFGEPLSKRKSTRSKNKEEDMSCTEFTAPEQNNLFQFVQEEERPSTSKTVNTLQLTIQSSKRKRAPSPCKEEDLFNFVSEDVSPLEGQRISEGCAKRFQSSSLQKTSAETETTLNLRKNVKRKTDGSDNADGKCNTNKLSRSVSPVSTMSAKISDKFDPSSSLWVSKKQFMAIHSTIKHEDDDCSGLSAENELLLKLKELDIKPAIVEIDNNLIVKKVLDISGLGSDVSDSSVDLKKNFKKFSKVKPLKGHTEVVSSFMLVAYEARTDNINMDNFANVSSDEENGNAEFASFMSLGRQKAISKGRTRRL